MRKPAAGDGGTSDLVTKIIAGADSSSFTWIAVKTDWRMATLSIVQEPSPEGRNAQDTSIM
jgi:hypothetical protein